MKPAIRFAYLGSGSKGNAAVIEAGTTRVLLDCGFSAKETAIRLQQLGLDGDQLDAIIVTHEHSDHMQGVGVVARKWNLPVWMSHGTWRVTKSQLGTVPAVEFVSPHEIFAIGDIEIEPYPVPHDAREPVQYVFGNGDKRLGILTDAGSVTSHMESVLSDCDALVLECNHDKKMLARGDYPPALKARVSGEYGHLDNEATAQLLEKIAHDSLQHVVAAHLSEKNNLESLACLALASALGCETDWIQVAQQDDGLTWLDVH